VLDKLDPTPTVDLVPEHGDPARRLTAVAERVEVAFLVIGAATTGLTTTRERTPIRAPSPAPCSQPPTCR
jgi:hypothetical protein